MRSQLMEARELVDVSQNRIDDDKSYEGRNKRKEIKENLQNVRTKRMRFQVMEATELVEVPIALHYTVPKDVPAKSIKRNWNNNTSKEDLIEIDIRYGHCGNIFKDQQSNTANARPLERNQQPHVISHDFVQEDGTVITSTTTYTRAPDGNSRERIVDYTDYVERIVAPLATVVDANVNDSTNAQEFVYSSCSDDEDDDSSAEDNDNNNNAEIVVT
ncbi:hypothetical protein FRX31_004667, partial [Thalictrum thalictroides]